MPKISKVNTNTPNPRKRPLSKWGFTTKEGGPITRFVFPESSGAYERMREHLENINNWGRYPGPHPEGRGSRNFNYMKIIPEFACIKIHSLLFPDGTVWDATMRRFRQIRDYEI